MGNEITKTFKTGLDKVTNTFLPSVVESLSDVGLETNDYQKQCMMGALTKMNELRKVYDYATKTYITKDWKDLDSTSIKNTLIQVAESELSLSAFPAEASVVLRGTQFTFAPQGEGWRKLTQKYGVGVKNIYEPWLVREKDDFKYPHFKGLEIQPPEWTPKGAGKVIRVVYPVEMQDGKVQYLIAEREDVKTNLLMAISNNMLKDPKGRDEILEKAKNMTLDQILADKEIIFKGNLSAAWKGASCEQMLIRKMKNNALKNFPKDYHNTFVSSAMGDLGSHDDIEATAAVIDMTADEDSKTEIVEQAMSEKKPSVSDFETPRPTPKPQPKPQPQEEPESVDEDLPF